MSGGFDLSWLRRVRTMRRGKAYPVAYATPAGLQALDAPPSPVEKDESRMYLGCVLATTARDREGDVLEVAGIDTTAHQRLPVAMVDHGMYYSLPIGECRSPEGAYTVSIQPDQGVCREGTYFRQHDEVAYQLYDMGCRGLLGNSIGYREIEVAPLRPDPSKGHFRRRDGTGGKHLLRIELTEVTWTAVPTNPECVQEEWSRDLIAGKRLAPAVKAMLRPWLPPRRAVLWTGEGKAMGETSRNRESEKPSGRESSRGRREEEHDEEEHPYAGEPHGSGFLKSYIADLHELHKTYAPHLKMLDHEGVKKFMTKALDQHADQMEAARACHGKHYPDADPPEDLPPAKLKPKKDGEEEEEEEGPKGKSEEEDGGEEAEMAGKCLLVFGTIAKRLGKTEERLAQVTGRG